MTDPPDVRVTRAQSHRVTGMATQDAIGGPRASAAHLGAPLMDMSSANPKIPLTPADALIVTQPPAAGPRAPDNSSSQQGASGSNCRA